MTFRDSPHRGIAGHLCDQVDVQRVERGLQAHACAGNRGLAAGMPGSDYNYVELFRELHLNRTWPSQCLGGTELEFNPSSILQGNFAQTHWVILLQTRASPVYIFAVPRETTLDPRQEILRTSARLFQQQGY